MNKINILNVWFLYPCLLFLFFYLSSCAQFLPYLIIQHSHSSGKLPLQLDLFHPPIYSHGPLDLEIFATVFQGRLQATLNEGVSVAPAYVWYVLVIVSTIDGLQFTFDKIISGAPASVWVSLVVVSTIYIPRSITSYLVIFIFYEVLSDCIEGTSG